MKLKVLVDNNTFIDMYYLAEPAVSYFIQDKDTALLFDTGYSDVFLLNAKKMGIDLNKADRIALSHGHNDHSGGLGYLKSCGKKFKLIAHPGAFVEREDDAGTKIGSPLSEEAIRERFDVSCHTEPYFINDRLVFLGQIETSLPFETRYAIGRKYENGTSAEDLILDDSALVYKGRDGLFIITGCSHAGICNIIEYAKKVCGCDKIHGVIGGFHLFENDERLSRTIDYLSENKIELLYPCHCVSLAAKIEIGRKLKIREVGVGLELDIE
ncbi:MAG: MBL fold metallo-hydrolase [Erysipelotrichaceae bacterium]|nr:MBL fold metallo-hydrolase [Erysipelotrichaceae bacterium]